MFPQNLSCFCRPWLPIVTFAWLAATAQYAAADAQDTFNVTVGTNITYDSNLFRRSENIPTPVGFGKRSDLIFISSATVSMRKFIGMQRLEAAGIFVDNRYNVHDFLNFFAVNYNAGWGWYLTPYFHGNVTTAHSEALNNFGNLTGFLSNNAQNIRTSDNHRFDGVFELTPALHLIGGVSQQVGKNSLLQTADFNNSVLSFEGGLRYVTRAGSRLTYTGRHGVGQFINRPEPIASSLFDTKFTDMEHELRLTWPVSAATTMEARVGYFQRTHAHFSERDFSGFVGNFNVNWAVTAKTSINAGWARDLANFQTSPLFLFQGFGFGQFSSSYMINNRFTISPVWQITSKTAFRARYQYILQDFHGPVTPVPANRSDATHSGMIALDWQPLNMLSLSAELRREHRSSNLLGFDYDVSAGSIIAKLNF
jgi:exopolysaccharide biosynthesis operon protein EpsL